MPRDEEAIPEIVGSSELIHEVRESVLFCAHSRSQVLLTGETGTGKSLVARAIHRLSARSEGPFVVVNCASLAPTLIESELFGHERGSFTGASTQHEGLFECAGSGTILLDEIGELDRFLQVKLLHVLEERSFARVGGTRSLQMQARVLTATNSDLEEKIIEGEFRRDLYYRLKVVHLHLPPLREHLDDIPELVAEGLRRLAAELRIARPSLSSNFLDSLAAHDWPGNVRELLNVLEAVLVRARGRELGADALQGILPTGRIGPEGGLETSREPSERELLGRLLVETGGNVARVARRARMKRSTVRYKIRRYGLEVLIPTD